MKKYNNGNDLSEKILAGVNKLADNVASTMGPGGRNVILHKKGGNPIITKDGVTVAKFVEFEDPFENAAAQIIKQASEKTNAIAGDGTTTATVLARAILINAQKYLKAGSNPVDLKRGIDAAVEVVVDSVTEQSQPISSEEDIANIAKISANGDSSIGDLVAKAVDLVGKDGAITIQEARSHETTLDVVEGFRFDSGICATAFVTDERRGVCKQEDAFVLVSDSSIETVEEIFPVLEIAARESRALTIVAENVEGQALAALIMNCMRGTMKVTAIKAPRYGEERRNILKDLATSVGATFISRESGMRLQEAKLEHLGRAKTIEASKTNTTIIGGNGDQQDIDNRIDTLKAEMSTIEDIRECEKTQERITRLSSGIAIINVGGATEVEMIEKKHRIEDALSAVDSAQVEGVVAGGGTALVKASQSLKGLKLTNEDQKLGVEIVKKAIEEPLRQMVKNAGASPDVVLEKVKASRRDGYNVATGKYQELISAGVLDPAKVTKTALRNAASASSVLLTADFAIVESEGS
jgi:chaperonin GroEL